MITISEIKTIVVLQRYIFFILSVYTFRIGGLLRFLPVVQLFGSESYLISTKLNECFPSVSLSDIKTNPKIVKKKCENLIFLFRI